MIALSKAEKDLYRNDGVHKEITITVPDLSITIDNSDIEKESVKLTERIETEKNLSFKGCNASVFSFRVAKFNTDIRGQYIEVTIQATGGQVLPLFCGYVATQTNVNYEDYMSEITAYDPLYVVLNQDVTAWYNALSFPISIKNMRDSFFSHVGMSQEAVALANDAQFVSKSITDKIITGATILKGICQINGRFGQFGRDKVFHYRKLGSISAGTFPSTTTYPSATLYPSEPNANESILKASYSACAYQPYFTKQISKVSIIGQNGAVQGENGTTTNDTFYLSDNKIAWGLQNAATAAGNLLNEVKDITFTPAEISAKGLPYIECGDIILANTRINAITTYVLERELVGTIALRDIFVGNIDEKHKPYTPTIETSVNANTQTAESAQSSATSAGTAASNAQNSANAAGTAANNAQNTANDAVWRVSQIEADYVRTGTINAINGEISNLKTRTATIENAYITEARCRTIVSNSINSYFANINDLFVRNISANQFIAGGVGYTPHTVNVRLANGSTRMIYYLGAN